MNLYELAKHPNKWHRLGSAQLGKVKAIAAQLKKGEVKVAPKVEKKAEPVAVEPQPVEAPVVVEQPAEPHVEEAPRRRGRPRRAREE